jgi:hypothetical protein
MKLISKKKRPAPLMLARFPGLLLPAHPATFKVGWPPGPFITNKLLENKSNPFKNTALGSDGQGPKGVSFVFLEFSGFLLK